MFFTQACAALAGMASLASAMPAPAPIPAPPEHRAVAHPHLEKRTIDLTIVQQIQETNIIVIQQNLDVIEELARIAEQQFAARIQAELALISTVETIKNNIRVNHFRNMFSTVNIIVVVVTSVLDTRDNAGGNMRYYVNQELADNGHPESQIMVMVTAAETMTIAKDSVSEVSATSAAEEEAKETSSAEIDNIIDQISAGSVGLPELRSYDAAFPFGQLDESVLLPFGTEAPKIDLVFEDPASIIFAGQTGIFVENAGTFAQDCSLFASLGNTFLTSAISIFTTFQQLSAAQAINLVIGSGMPPSILFETTSAELETATATEYEAHETATETEAYETETETEEATATEIEDVAMTTMEEAAETTEAEGEKEMEEMPATTAAEEAMESSPVE
ncbi:hypothetical protein MKZ38_002151 [Zalerion maritima]|uniref:Uncharacterized protein n=1 Tax=Zalerion maritima TaxID=339359 RepID=A0AAD5RPD5_9PEZI|nr:hypothetical protein MKZ38_002151 [Zalerion maritima]